ncbi:MAG: hypothetical protein LBH82_03435 [Bacteroidales bacterium]|jgi:hypothetical protein|nr:hypothetical protein [Bacteroidales bacterium]
MGVRKYKYYWILILLVSIFFCRCKKSDTNEACQEKVYKSDDGYCVFLINDEFYTVQKWDEDGFQTFPADDSIISSQTGRIYYKQIFSSYSLKYDTIEIANSMELPRHCLGFLYNLRIVDKKWEIALYYPSGDESIKGTYSFHITESENKMFKGILNKFQENAKQKYYPIQDTTKHYSISIPAFYLKIQPENESFEYFGTTALFNMLSQITTIIIGNHILPENSDNKISDTIKLLDIRERFNSYVGKDCCTGFIVEDFDSLIPPPVPK